MGSLVRTLRNAGSLSALLRDVQSRLVGLAVVQPPCVSAGPCLAISSPFVLTNVADAEYLSPRVSSSLQAAVADYGCAA